MSTKDKMRLAWQQRWPAPAKLNLMLRIVGRRNDGYHLLQTVFQFVELCDWLTFHPDPSGMVWLKKPIAGVPEATDLTIRAANLLKAESGYSQGVCIDIEKNLPMGGGLGGGSSDAATTLLVLNKLWELNYSTEELMHFGLRLGADVPVFVYGFSAWAEGVGELLAKMTVPEQWVVIIKPDCHVNTKAIFSAENLTRDSKPIKMSGFFAAGQQQNDCLAVVRQLHPPVEQALATLSRFGHARLTGTGACVFAQFDSEKAARSAYAALPPDWEVYLTKGINKSPLLQKLEKF